MKAIAEEYRYIVGALEVYEGYGKVRARLAAARQIAAWPVHILRQRFCKHRGMIEEGCPESGYYIMACPDCGYTADGYWN
jgi:hypothetical protein